MGGPYNTDLLICYTSCEDILTLTGNQYKAGSIEVLLQTYEKILGIYEHIYPSWWPLTAHTRFAYARVLMERSRQLVGHAGESFLERCFGETKKSFDVLSVLEPE